MKKKINNRFWANFVLTYTDNVSLLIIVVIIFGGTMFGGFFASILKQNEVGIAGYVVGIIGILMCLAFCFGWVYVLTTAWYLTVLKKEYISDDDLPEEAGE